MANWSRAKLDVYKAMSAEWGKAQLRHGAMYFSDAIGDDAQPGKLTSFPQAVQLEDDEVVAVSWIVYENKEDRDRISRPSWTTLSSRSRWIRAKCPSMASGAGSRRSWDSRASRPP
jgi:uncharacterized protein YbaA (DUF1428 family)